MTIFPSAASEIQTDEWKYSGIGGWLIPVTIGLCLSPLFQSAYVITTLMPIFTKGSWAVLTTPGSPAYHHLWGPVILLETSMNVGLPVSEILLLVLLFRRKRLFPRLMIGYLFISFALIASDYFLAQGIPAVAHVNSPDSAGAVIRSGLMCAIWVSYFLRSKRVRGTFCR